LNKPEAVVLGMALGAGLTYLLDPDRGGRRRALVRDQLVHAEHELEDRTRAGVRHARNRATGLAHEAQARLVERDVDDRVLEERVRSEIGRDLTNPSAVEVLASGGRVTLAGSIPADEVQDVIRKTRSVRGVEQVDNRFDVPAHPDDMRNT
jgi:osmotically-inducible protein OsmY